MHGTKDYGNVAPKETTYQLTDMAELAVRLGALSSLDRLGDVIFQEDFSNGIDGWKQAISGTGGSISLSTGFFKSGGFAAKLVGGTSGLGYAAIYMNLPYTTFSNFGIEVSFAMNINVDCIDVSLITYFGNYKYQGYVAVYPATNKIYYFNDAYAEVELVSNAKVVIDVQSYNNFKLVIDMVNKKYKRFCWNNGVVSMVGLNLNSEPTLFPAYMTIALDVYSKAGLNGICYVDNVIVTQNEP